jgi:hypothetical protein
MAARYEYKVVQLREKVIGGKLSGDQLEQVLKERAAKGWQLKFQTTAGGELNPLRILFTFERQTAGQRQPGRRPRGQAGPPAVRFGGRSAASSCSA